MYPRAIINEFLAAKDCSEPGASPRVKLTQALCTAVNQWTPKSLILSRDYFDMGPFTN